MQRKLYKIFFLLVLLNTGIIFSQDGINTNLFDFTDSTKIKNEIKWLNLKDWKIYNQGTLSLQYRNSVYNFDRNRYLPNKVMPKDPFKLDYRSSSYYVPRMVKDELNLIMNRPKDSAFLPVLGVAFLAAQLAAKYIFLMDKIKISTENVLNTIDDYEILNTLWVKNPQTAYQLYEIPVLRKTHTLSILLERIESLIDNKLIKQKNVKKEEMLFFPALSKTVYEQLLEKALSEISTSKSDRKKIQKIISK